MRPNVQLPEPAPCVRIAGRALEPTPVFETYWRFAVRRHAIYLARLNGSAPPWTGDPILARHRFTNAYRAADRVSQYLIGAVQYGAGVPRSAEDVVFRTLLFKCFNKIETWQHLESVLGEVSWRSYEFDRYSRALDVAASEMAIYSPAYVVPPPRLGESAKRRNHLRLVELMMRGGIVRAVASGSLRLVYGALREFPSVGPFLAYQFAIDLNYSPVMDAAESEFVVAGPGACDGIRKCFGPASHGIESEVIHYVAATQEQHFARLGLDFPGLFGRPLQLIDCQNLFCEVDKYARVAHPQVRGVSGRTRIKQRYTPSAAQPTAFFPPRWGLDPPPVVTSLGLV